MKAVKGVVFKMLADAYQKRDRVGMIAFRRDRAEVLLPITRSIEFAQKEVSSTSHWRENTTCPGTYKSGRYARQALQAGSVTRSGVNFDY